MGVPIAVASPALADKIDECIQYNMYLDDIAEIDGNKCSVQDIDNRFYYIFGDEDNLTPTMQEVIESVEDVATEEEIKSIAEKAEKDKLLNRITDLTFKMVDDRLHVRCKIDGKQHGYVLLTRRDTQDFNQLHATTLKEEFLKVKLSQIHADKLQSIEINQDKGVKR